MVVETAKNQICINQLVGQKKEQITAEGDVIVNDIKPDVLNIVSANGVLSVYKKEVMNGKIRIDGNINTYIIYLADDENGRIRTLNTSLDFTKIIEMEEVKEGMTLDEDLKLKNFEYKVLNGRKINIKAFLEINARVYSNDCFEIITNLDNSEDIQILNNEEKIISLLGEGCNRTYAKDTISIDEIDDLAEIMKVDFKIINEEVKTSYNKILSKADVDICIMYLTEDNRINKVRALVPVMGFVDIQNINEDCICNAKNRLRNIVIKPNSSEEHSIYVEAEIELTCYAYEVKDIEIIEDLYSLSADMKFKTQEINAMVEKNEKLESCEIRENITIPEIQNETVYGISAKPKINSQKARNGKVIYDGEIEIEILFNKNNSMESKTMNVPLNFETNIDNVNENSNIETRITVINEDFIIKDGGNANINIELEFKIQTVNTKVINAINELYLEETKNEDIYSMVIYFVKQGDTLWKIAKKFKSRVEDIARVNNIENENLIHVGQQLYIPKFSRTNVLV